MKKFILTGSIFFKRSETIPTSVYIKVYVETIRVFKKLKKKEIKIAVICGLTI